MTVSDTTEYMNTYMIILLSHTYTQHRDYTSADSGLFTTANQ